MARKHEASTKPSSTPSSAFRNADHDGATAKTSKTLTSQASPEEINLVRCPYGKAGERNADILNEGVSTPPDIMQILIDFQKETSSMIGKTDERDVEILKDKVSSSPDPWRMSSFVPDSARIYGKEAIDPVGLKFHKAAYLRYDKAAERNADKFGEKVCSPPNPFRISSFLPDSARNCEKRPLDPASSVGDNCVPDLIEFRKETSLSNIPHLCNEMDLCNKMKSKEPMRFKLPKQVSRGSLHSASSASKDSSLQLPKGTEWSKQSMHTYTEKELTDPTIPKQVSHRFLHSGSSASDDASLELPNATECSKQSMCTDTENFRTDCPATTERTKQSMHADTENVRTDCPVTKMMNLSYNARTDCPVTTIMNLSYGSSNSCPFFSGAADANAALRRRQSKTFTRDNSLSSLLPLENSGSSNRFMHTSFTQTNAEFPDEIKEVDLFDHSTCNGFFSRLHGFQCPDYEGALQALLRSKGRIWYTMGLRMQGLLSNNGFMKAIEGMEILHGNDRTCPDESLQIAASILAHLTVGYRAACNRNNLKYRPSPSLQIPFSMICKRLGRKDVYMAPEDLMYNQRPNTASNMGMITPVWGTSAENLMSKLFCESNKHFLQMLDAILALCRGEWNEEHICSMIAAIKGFTRTLGKAIPDGSAGSSSIDPVEFNVAFANSVSPLKEDVPALSGAGCPIFVCIDVIIGRKTWDSTMGADLLLQIDWMPKNWRRFVEYLRQKRLFEKVPAEYSYLWNLFKDSYCGERGWLGRHKYRAYQFIELASNLGRTSNKGTSTAGKTVTMLEESRRERDPSFTDDRSSYKACHFKGRIKSKTRVSEDHISKLITIESSNPLSLHIGDHIAIIMKNNDDRILEFASKYRLDLNSSLCVEDGTLSIDWAERLDFDDLPYTVYNVLMCAKLASGGITNLTVHDLCKVLKPEEPRLYSFASVHPSDKCVTTFDLFVTRTGPGGCSAFLHESVGAEVSFGISTAVNMHIPAITTRPLVVIAAGSGVGTFLPLLVNENIYNDKYAFLAFRTENTVPYLHSHLEKAVNYGALQLFVELSREDVSLVTDNRLIKRRQSKKRYIGGLLREEAELIRELAMPQDEGGLEASFFICGNSDFFNTIRTTLDQIDNGLVERLARSNRLELEVQTRGGKEGQGDAKPIKLTEICWHNTMEDYYTIIDGVVYDFTEYLPWHPGGRKVLHLLGGTDCTQFWNTVGHNRDRMVYTQISAYEVGPYGSTDPDGLMAFLEYLTRLENCVDLYKEKEDLFKTICDSYEKVQSLIEGVFADDFYDLVMTLVTDDKTLLCMFRRLWSVKHGVARVITNRLFSVAPIMKDIDPWKFLEVPGVRNETLRPISHEERKCLEARLMSCSKQFFVRCKTAVVDAATALEAGQTQPHVSNMRMSFRKVVDIARTQNKPHAVYTRMFFRLISSFEELYSSLSKPLPVSDVRCWDVVRTEVMSRKTFALRFNHEEMIVPQDYERLILQRAPATKEGKGSYFDQVTKFLDIEMVPENCFDFTMSTDIIDDWLKRDDIRRVFDRLDKNGDGLVSRSEIMHGKPASRGEDLLLKGIRKALEENDEAKTFNYKEFLLLCPDMVKKKRIVNVVRNLSRGLVTSPDTENKNKIGKMVKSRTMEF